MKRVKMTEEMFCKVRTALNKYPMMTHLEIGQLCGVCGTTVARVRKCATWEDWLTLKAAENAKISQTKPMKGQMEMQEIPVTQEQPKRIKVYFTNGNTAVFPQEKARFWNTLPVNVEPGTIAVNWNTVAWMREYEEE